MKNSSRLLAEIETKRSRSSSGWLVFPASSSTRMLNCSQLTSRLTKRGRALPQLGGIGRLGCGFRRFRSVSFIVVAFRWSSSSSI